MAKPSGDGITELRTTRWHNPTEHKQRVIIHPEARGEHPVAITWEPGETKEVAAKYDRAIHMVDCGRDECHRAGWFCSKGHPGHIQGGAAPLLQRVGATDVLNPVLDPDVAAKKEAESALVAQAVISKAAQMGMIQALAQGQEATAKIERSEAAAKVAPPAPKPEPAPKAEEKPKPPYQQNR